MIKIKTFNILDEPWIPIRDDKGILHHHGIVETLLTSHNKIEIKDASPLFQYGIYRLLTTIIADVYRPEIVGDIRDVLRVGHFDEEKIIEYFSDKRNRFDLFDPEYPFLQVKPSPDYETKDKIKSVANLLPQIPTGNNDILFVHKLETEHALSPEICTKALCTVGLFSTAGVQGYASGVNGAPPWYVIINGKNLFETLVLNIGLPDMETQYDDNVAWMSQRKIEPRKKVHEISYIEGLMWQTRRISLIPEPENGTCTYTGKENTIVVRNMFFQQGLDYDGYNLWRDPHTSNYVNENGSGTLKPQPTKPLWREVGSLLLLKDYPDGKKQIHRPTVINQYFRLKDRGYIQPEKSIHIEVFGLATNQAKNLTWQHEKMAMPTAVADSKGKGQMAATLIQHSLEKCENVARLIKTTINSFYSDNKKSKNMNTLAIQAETKFWATMKTIFFLEYIPAMEKALQNSDVDKLEWSQEPQSLWNEKLKQIARKITSQTIDQLGSDSETLKMSVRASASLNIGIAKIINNKKGKKE